VKGRCSVIGDSRGVCHLVAGRVFTGAAFALFFAMVTVLLPAVALHGQQNDSMQPAGATLHGVVYDAAGRTVAGAHVVLRGDSPPVSREETTDAAGQFTFKGVATGTFSLTASWGSMQSTTVAVNLSTPGEQQPVNVVLGGPQTKAPTTQEASQSMQFADQPDFAIAAVTDWTAAGGHGSDSSLRTSEALTRQAVNLKPRNTEPAVAGSSGGAAKLEESEGALHAAVAKDPKGFEANFRLGRFYVQAGQYEDAIQPLQTAYQADPANYQNEDDLAQALEMAGNASGARDHVRQLLARQESADCTEWKGNSTRNWEILFRLFRHFNRQQGWIPAK